MTEIPEQPKILVFGAGAVGSLLGGILAHAGYSVTLLGRERSVDAIRNHGLNVQLHDRQFRAWPEVISDSSLLRNRGERFDVVLLTVRSYAVADAIGSLQPVLCAGGTLVSLQNGVGSEELIARELPGVNLVAGSLTLSADAAEPGAASSSSRSGSVCFAPVSPGAPVEEIASMFRAAGMTAWTVSDYRSMKWSKLLLNQMANGIPAILGWSPGEVYRRDDVFRVEQALLRETLRVIAADDMKLVALPGFPVPVLRWVLQAPPWLARRLLVRSVEGGRGDKPPSLALDLQAGRTQTEARWLYGSVAKAGERLGVKAPINRRVYRILEAVATNPALRGSFVDNPDLLIRNILAARRQPSGRRA